jgi:hypothetical protein
MRRRWSFWTSFTPHPLPHNPHSSPPSCSWLYSSSVLLLAMVVTILKYNTIVSLNDFQLLSFFIISDSILVLMVVFVFPCRWYSTLVEWISWKIRQSVVITRNKLWLIRPLTVIKHEEYWVLSTVNIFGKIFSVGTEVKSNFFLSARSEIQIFTPSETKSKIFVCLSWD